MYKVTSFMRNLCLSMPPLWGNSEIRKLDRSCLQKQVKDRDVDTYVDILVRLEHESKFGWQT